MFFYIFDKRLSGVFEKRRIDKALSYIKAHQIAGEYHNASSVEEITSLAKTAISKHFKTVVVIGDDSSLIGLLNSAAESSTEAVAFGFIPVTKKSHAANELKLPDYRKALRALTTRKLTSLKLISLNSHFFPLLLEFAAGGQTVDITIDNKLKLSLPLSTVVFENNYHNLVANQKPITLIATSPADQSKTKDASFLELKTSLVDPTVKDAPTLRINAKSVKLEGDKPLTCASLAKSYKKLEVGQTNIDVRMIVAKSSGFNS